jgi:hypothetical protein
MLIDEFSDIIRDHISLQCSGCIFIEDCRIKDGFQERIIKYEIFGVCPCVSCIIKMICSDDGNCPHFIKFMNENHKL